MTLDIQSIVQSKQQFRRTLAVRPVAEKLAMLDALRERTRLLRTSVADAKTPRFYETPSDYRIDRTED